MQATSVYAGTNIRDGFDIKLREYIGCHFKPAIQFRMALPPSRVLQCDEENGNLQRLNIGIIFLCAVPISKKIGLTWAVSEGRGRY